MQVWHKTVEIFMGAEGIKTLTAVAEVCRRSFGVFWGVPGWLETRKQHNDL